MKKVLGSHAQTAHVWAQNTQSEGKSSDKRMFFEDGVIYSYGRHFAIAAHVKDLKGANCVLFTTGRYSVSTSKHISHVRAALRGDYKVYYVPIAEPQREQANLAAFDSSIAAAILSYTAPRIRQATRDGIAEDVKRLTEARNAYGLAFVKKYKVLVVPDDINKAALQIEAHKKRQAKALEKKRLEREEQVIRHAEACGGVTRDKWASLWRSGTMPMKEEDYAIRSTMKAWLHHYAGTLLRVRGDIIETPHKARSFR